MCAQLHINPTMLPRSDEFEADLEERGDAPCPRAGRRDRRDRDKRAGAWRQVTVAGAVVVVMSLAACGGSSPSAPSPTTAISLRQALARVADTDGTRSQIYYDDTSALVTLAGRNLGGTAGFAVLRGSGAEGLQSLAQVISSQPGIQLFDADYTITAGSPPSQVGLLAGGQPGSSITGNLTKVGWRQQGNTLVGPSPLSAGGDQQETAMLALNLARVRTNGSDVTYGEASADLDQIGSPSGRTLAQDPAVDAAAHCLGDVVAADHTHRLERMVVVNGRALTCWSIDPQVRAFVDLR